MVRFVNTNYLCDLTNLVFRSVLKVIIQGGKNLRKNRIFFSRARTVNFCNRTLFIVHSRVTVPENFGAEAEFHLRRIKRLFFKYVLLRWLRYFVFVGTEIYFICSGVMTGWMRNTDNSLVEEVSELERKIKQMEEKKHEVKKHEKLVEEILAHQEPFVRALKMDINKLTIEILVCTVKL